MHTEQDRTQCCEKADKVEFWDIKLKKKKFSRNIDFLAFEVPLELLEVYFT